MIQPPLPEMPEPPARTPPKPRTGESFTRYKTPRRLCDMCIFLIHRYGWGNAEPPRVAKWRRATPEETRFVCEQHREVRL
jgi:hypothetical protein